MLDGLADQILHFQSASSSNRLQMESAVPFDALSERNALAGPIIGMTCPQSLTRHALTGLSAGSLARLTSLMPFMGTPPAANGDLLHLASSRPLSERSE